MKEQDMSFNQLKHEYEREIKHLRVLLQEREEMMQMVAGEKKYVLLLYYLFKKVIFTSVLIKIQQYADLAGLGISKRHWLAAILQWEHVG